MSRAATLLTALLALACGGTPAPPMTEAEVQAQGRFALPASATELRSYREGALDSLIDVRFTCDAADVEPFRLSISNEWEEARGGSPIFGSTTEAWWNPAPSGTIGAWELHEKDWSAMLQADDAGDGKAVVHWESFER